MKIKRFWISKFKNLNNLELIFDTDLTSLIVGQNGLGKSNIIEALSIIFNHLCSLEKESDLLNLSNLPFEFELEYICRNSLICLTFKNEDKFIRVDDENLYLDIKKFIKNKNIYLPDLIITYYSGQNTRLRTIYEQFEEDFFKLLRKHNKDEKAEYFFEFAHARKQLYLKNYHSQFILFTLLIFERNNHTQKAKSKISNLLLNYLGITSIQSISLNLSSPMWIKYMNDEEEYNEVNNKNAVFLEANMLNDVKYPFWNLKSGIDKLLTCFYNASSSENKLPTTYANNDIIKSKKDYKENIEFVNLEIENLAVEILELFKSPLELLLALEALNIVGILDLNDGLSFKIKKNITDPPIDYHLLSEGEQQLLTVLGSILMIENQEVLFLLDEPDTYLNPKWQRDYIQLLDNFNLNDEKSHIIVSTHSPLLVQNIEGDEGKDYDLFLLYISEDNKLKIDSKDHVITNWRLDQVLASKYFNIENTRPSHTDHYLKIKQEIIRKGELTKTDINQLKELEDELGYLPLGETITEIESLAFLNYLSKKDDLHK